MSRVPKPWWWKARQSWFIQTDGQRRNLGPDRTLAFQRYHEVMARPRQKAAPADSVLATIDAFLDWTSKHRACSSMPFWLRKKRWRQPSVLLVVGQNAFGRWT